MKIQVQGFIVKLFNLLFLFNVLCLLLMSSSVLNKIISIEIDTAWRELVFNQGFDDYKFFSIKTNIVSEDFSQTKLSNLPRGEFFLLFSIREEFDPYESRQGRSCLPRIQTNLPQSVTHTTWVNDPS